jgi:hypothetical protein
MVLIEAVLLPKGSVRSLLKTFKNIILQLSMILHFVWYYSRSFDIVTTFLYGRLDEEIYMKFLEAYEKFLKEHHGKNISYTTHCVLLL